MSWHSKSAKSLGKPSSAWGCVPTFQSWGMFANLCGCFNSLHLRRLGTGNCIQRLHSGVSIHALSTVYSNLPMSWHMLANLYRALLGLLGQGGIVQVPVAEWFQGFLSNLFIPPRPKVCICSILDLKTLNVFFQVHKFHMKSTKSGFCGHQRYLPTCSIFPAYQRVLYFVWDPCTTD